MPASITLAGGLQEMTWGGPSGGTVSVRGLAGNRTQPSEDRGGKGGVREPAGKTRGQEPQQGATAPPGLTGLWMEADVSPKWGGSRAPTP